MNIVSFLGKFFGRDSEADASKSVAKQRLRLVLVHDRPDVSETIMNSLGRPHFYHWQIYGD